MLGGPQMVLLRCSACPDMHMCHATDAVALCALQGLWLPYRSRLRRPP